MTQKEGGSSQYEAENDNPQFLFIKNKDLTLLRMVLRSISSSDRGEL